MSRKGDELLAELTGIKVAPDGDPDPGVLAVLELGRASRRGAEPRPKSTKENTILVLERDPRWAGRIRGNELDGLIYLDGAPIRDEQETGIYRWIYQHYAFHAGDTDLTRAIAHLAYQERYHPIRDYLEALTWDGVERLPTWLWRYCKASSAPLVGRIGTCWAISAVARVMRPGCKVDTCLIFKAGQGATKSTTFELLAINPDWFSDSDVDLTSKDKYQTIRGVWIFELAELSSIRKADNNAVKSFVTSKRDRYRPAFGKYLTVQPRQTVFVGTTNEESFLTDPTGSRRFWPVSVGQIDQAGLMKVRDQLWAEALHRFRAGEQWWLTPDEERDLYEHNQQYRQPDIWEDTIATWAGKQAAPFTSGELLESAFGREMAGANGRDDVRIRSVLTALGYARKRCRLAGKGQRTFWWPAGESYEGKTWGAQ